MFSVHMALITGACALIRALQAGREVRLGAQPSAGRGRLEVEVPVSHT